MNSISLIGRLGTEVNVRTKPNGTPTASFRLAVEQKKSDGQGNYVDDTLWIDVVAFGRQAEVVERYLRKGLRVALSGRLRFEQWEKDGVKRSKHLVVVERLTLVDYPDGQRPPAAERQAPAAAPAPAGRTTRQPERNSFDDMEDDIPF